MCNRVHTAVLYGGLQYDMEPTAMIEEAKKYDLSNLLAVRGDVVRGDSIFRELRGSKEEVIKVESVLKKQNGMSLLMLERMVRKSLSWT